MYTVENQKSLSQSKMGGQTTQITQQKQTKIQTKNHEETKSSKLVIGCSVSLFNAHALLTFVHIYILLNKVC